MNKRSFALLALSSSLLISACSGGGGSDDKQQPSYSSALPGNLAPASGINGNDYNGMWLQTIRLKGDLVKEQLDDIGYDDFGDIELVQNHLMAFSSAGDNVLYRPCADLNTYPGFSAIEDPLFSVSGDQLTGDINAMIEASSLKVLKWDFDHINNPARLDATDLGGGLIRYQSDQNVWAELTTKVQIPGQNTAENIVFDYRGSVSVEWAKVSDVVEEVSGAMSLPGQDQATGIACLSAARANLTVRALTFEIQGQARQMKMETVAGDQLILDHNEGFNEALGGFDHKAKWVANDAPASEKTDAGLQVSLPVPDMQQKQFTGSFITADQQQGSMSVRFE